MRRPRLESVRSLWQGLRRITGDDAYERYLERHRQCPVHGGEKPLDQKAFYEMELRRRWGGIRRCC
jgi:uncharacterized short protein YbdD (DUF466 family)